MTALTTSAGSAKRAGNTLGISAKTIDSHAYRARLRLGARSRIEAILMWDRFIRGEQ